jgi:hypothetical protein
MTNYHSYAFSRETRKVELYRDGEHIGTAVTAHPFTQRTPPWRNSMAGRQHMQQRYGRRSSKHGTSNGKRTDGKTEPQMFAHLRPQGA